MQIETVQRHLQALGKYSGKIDGDFGPMSKAAMASLSLGQKQRLFTRMVGLLIEYAYQSGYEMSFGDAYRDPRAFGPVGTRKLYSSANSNHKRRLAVDFNLFKDGKFLTASEDHAPLGHFWESMGGAWGGRFSNPDGNHYSLEHEGFK